MYKVKRKKKKEKEITQDARAIFNKKGEIIDYELI
jgi:hypothetical protein